ncbi:MAG: hypothetical protein ACPGJS_10760 [Flammeovirgaceae bacterium]
MNEEQLFFSKNIKDFLDEAAGKTLKYICFDINPPYDFKNANLNFKFRYALRVFFSMEHGDFRMACSDTSDGLSALYVEKCTFPNNDNKCDEKLDVNAIFGKSETYLSKEGLIEKLKITCGQTTWTFIPAEIYLKSDGNFRYVKNDEMVFVFDNDEEVSNFEKELKATDNL